MSQDTSDPVRNLHRIAETLGVSVGMLLATVDDEGVAASRGEIQRLLNAFLPLRDPRARQRVIRLAEAEAGAARIGAPGSPN